MNKNKIIKVYWHELVFSFDTSVSSRVANKIVKTYKVLSLAISIQPLQKALNSPTQLVQTSNILQKTNSIRKFCVFISWIPSHPHKLFIHWVSNERVQFFLKVTDTINQISLLHFSIYSSFIVHHLNWISERWKVAAMVVQVLNTSLVVRSANKVLQKKNVNSKFYQKWLLGSKGKVIISNKWRAGANRPRKCYGQ